MLILILQRLPIIVLFRRRVLHYIWLNDLPLLLGRSLLVRGLRLFHTLIPSNCRMKLLSLVKIALRIEIASVVRSSNGDFRFFLRLKSLTMRNLINFPFLRERVLVLLNMSTNLLLYHFRLLNDLFLSRLQSNTVLIHNFFFSVECYRLAQLFKKGFRIYIL